MGFRTKCCNPNRRVAAVIQRTPSLRTRAGATLMETMSTLAILGVLAGAGGTAIAPSVLSILAQKAEVHAFALLLQSARAKALTSRETVTVRFRREQSHVRSYSLEQNGKQLEQGQIPENVKILTRTSVLSFNVDGSVNTTASFEVDIGTARKSIVVNKITGIVTIEDEPEQDR